MMAKIVGGLLGLALIVTGFVVVPLSTGETGDQRYSAYNDGHFTSLQRAREILSESEEASYDVTNVGTSPMVLRDVDPRATILFIVAMERPYASYEMKAMDSFLERGGHIVLLDDGAYGNQFSKRHGIEFLRVSVLADFEHNKSFVWADANLEGGAHDLALADPVALEDINATSALRPSIIVKHGFLDLNDDGQIDAIDKGGQEGSSAAKPINIGIQRDFPGGGRLTVISDSGWISDDMIDRAIDPDGVRSSNAVFLKALVADALGSEGGLVMFDESRRGTVSLESGVYQVEKGLLGLFRSIPVIGVVFAAAALTLLVLMLMQIPGPDDWRHRFRPGAAVGSPRHTQRQLLREVLESQVRLAGGLEKISDDAIRQAGADPENLRDDDISLVLDRIVTNLTLELKPLQDEDIPT